MLVTIFVAVSKFLITAMEGSSFGAHGLRGQEQGGGSTGQLVTRLSKGAETNAGTSLFLYSVSDPRPSDGATHTQRGSSRSYPDVSPR